MSSIEKTLLGVHRRTSVRATLVVVLPLLVCWGCDGGTPLGSVTGTVTYNGQPVDRGEIRLISLEAGESTDAGVIIAGRFSFLASGGTRRVEIRGSRPLPAQQQTEPEMGLMYEDYIPARFNTQSTLSAEIGEDDSHELRFDLTRN